MIAVSISCIANATTISYPPVAQSNLKDIGEPFQFSGLHYIDIAPPHSVKFKVDYNRSMGTISVEGMDTPEGAYNVKVLPQSTTETVFVAGEGSPFKEYCVFTFTTDLSHTVHSKAEPGIDNNNGQYSCSVHNTFTILVEK